MSRNSFGVENYSNFETITTGLFQFTKPANSAQAEGTLFHNLGYIPFFLVMWTLNGPDSDVFAESYGQADPSGSTAGLVGVQFNAQIYSDRLIGILRTPNYAGNGFYSSESNVTVRYCLFREAVR